MIAVTRLNGTKVIISSDLIETVEETPDTVITFAHTKRMVVLESADEIVRKIIQFRRQIFMLRAP